MEYLVVQRIANTEYSASKVLWHPKKINSFLDRKVSAPIYVRIKPTNNCNHSCFYCLYNPDFSGIHTNIRRQDKIPNNKMMEILSDFKDIGVKAVTYSGGGEPLIYPFIEETMRKTLDYKIDLSIITNGQKLSRERAEILSQAHWVRISTDSCDAKTFFNIRGRPESWFYGLIDNIKQFAKIKNKSCVLGINFPVNEKNKNKVFEAAKFYRDLGADNIKFTPIWSPNFLEYHAPFKERVIEQIEKAKQEFTRKDFKIFDTYEVDFSSSKTNQRNFSRCYIAETIPVIGADSNVYLCHDKSYSKKGIIGSMENQSFRELWFSEQTIETFKKFDPLIECREHPCTNNKKNIEIENKIHEIKNKMKKGRTPKEKQEIQRKELELMVKNAGPKGSHSNFI